MSARTLRDKKVATGLLLGFLMIFYVAALGTEYIQSIDHGYGSGLTNRQYVSGDVIERFETQLGRDIPNNITAEQLADLTNKTPDLSLWGETWRWVASIALMLGLLWFWWVVIARIGAI